MLKIFISRKNVKRINNVYVTVYALFRGIYVKKNNKGLSVKIEFIRKHFQRKCCHYTFLPPFGYILKQTATDMPCTPVSMIETQNFNPTSPENVNNAVINKHNKQNVVVNPITGKWDENLKQ